MCPEPSSERGREQESVRRRSAALVQSRRAASGVEVMRSSVPSAWAEEASSSDPGAASRRASATRLCTTMPDLRSARRIGPAE